MHGISHIKTERIFLENQPDITIRDKENGSRALIEVSISGKKKANKKETETILKHKDLTIEIQRMWNVKTKVKPVRRGKIEIISESFRK
jgi:hypothetical protein